MSVLVVSNGRPPNAQLDLDEIREKYLAGIGVTLVLLGGVASWLLLPGLGFSLPRFALFFSLFLSGCMIYHLRTKSVLAAQCALLFGPALGLALALKAYDEHVIPFFAVLAVIANSASSPRLGFAAAGLNTASICALLPSSEVRTSALVLLWISAGLEWIASRGLYSALAWAWSSQDRANRLLTQLRERQGQLNRTLVALTEATRRLEHTGRELAIARLRADEAREVKERFAANISHELRTPLNLILGFSEMMYLSPDVYGDMAWPPTLRRDVQQVYQSTRQLMDLVNDVLDLAQVDAAEMPIQKTTSDLNAVICEAVETVRGLTREHDLEIRTGLPQTTVYVSMDRTRVRQVLINLLNNAVRFTPHGVITVTAEVDEQQVVVSVADTGVGISPEHLSRIFDGFFQADMSLRRPNSGAGLGLAISKRFIELHGGRIWAESQEGLGSIFHFSLPLTPAASFAELVAGRAAEPQLTESDPMVVVVDDDPAVGMLLRRYLPQHDIRQVKGLEQAGDLAAKLGPQALVLNLYPEQEAWQTIRQQALDALPSDLPVLLCSLPSQSWLALEARVQGCLGKPVNREQLLTALGEFGGVRDVLVIDDDVGFCLLVARFLESESVGYRVRWATTGQEALAQIRREAPEAILLDLAMPGMDGFQLLDVLRSLGLARTVPILIVTGAGCSQDMLAERSGVVGVARGKGFSAGEAIRCLEALLEALDRRRTANARAPAEAAHD